MNGLLKNITIEDISVQDIAFTKDCLIGFETEQACQQLPVLLKKEDRYFPVSCFGMLRDAAARTGSVRAFVSADRSAVFDLLLGLRGQSLNFVEKLLIMKNYRSSGDERESSLEKYLPLLELPEKALVLVAGGKLSPDTAQSLLDVTPADRDHFLGLAVQYRLNANQQREALSHFRDLARSGQRTFGDVTAALPLRETGSRPDRAEDVMIPLRALALPRYHETLEQFGRLKKELGLPRKMNVKETPFFESKTLSIEMFFSSLPDLKKAAATLTDNISRKERVWEDVFRLL